MQDSKPETEPVWCVVANIRDTTFCGPYQQWESVGHKHFSSGTKVFCLPRQWCPTYGRLIVLARHRGSHRLIQIVIAVRFLNNIRVKRIYHPGAIEAMIGYWDASEDSRQRAEALAESLRAEIGETELPVST